MLSCYRVHSNTASPGRRPTSVCVFAPADIMEHESRSNSATVLMVIRPCE